MESQKNAGIGKHDNSAMHIEQSTHPDQAKQITSDYQARSSFTMNSHKRSDC